MSTQRNQDILSHIERLTESLVKYRDHMKGDSRTHARSRLYPEVSTSADHDTTLQYIPGTPRVSEHYQALDSFLSSADCDTYEFVDLAEFSPDDRIKRRRYVKDIRVSMSVMLFRIAYGGSLGTLNFVWKVDDDHSESDRVVRDAHAASQVRTAQVLLQSSTT